MKKKQKSFTIKPEFLGQTIYELPPDFPKDFEEIHGVYLGEFLRNEKEFFLDLENMTVKFMTTQPLGLDESFSLVVY